MLVYVPMEERKFKFSINVQYYVSNLNYMNHLLKLIRETERQFSLLCLHFKSRCFFLRLMLHLTCICLLLGFAFSQHLKAAVESSGIFLFIDCEKNNILHTFSACRQNGSPFRLIILQSERSWSCVSRFWFTEQRKMWLKSAKWIVTNKAVKCVTRLERVD